VPTILDDPMPYRMVARAYRRERSVAARDNLRRALKDGPKPTEIMVNFGN